MNPKYHLLVAVAALSLGACSTDDTCTDPVPENEGRKISFTVAEDAETRTTLEMLEAGNFLRWVSTDKVGIYTVGRSVNSNIVTTADVKKSPVEFVGTLEQTVSSGDMFYAYYPYAAAQSTDPSAVKLSIPAEQQQTEAGVYNGESHPLVAVPMEFSQEWGTGRISSVRFRQLGAIVELQLYSSDETLRSESIRAVTFESDTPLSGDFSFDLTSVTMKEDLPISGYESKMVTTSLEAPVAIPATKDEAARVYLTIAPGQYTGQIVVKTDVAQYTFTLAKTMTFNRAAIKGLPADLSKATRELFIPFEDPEVKQICVNNWDTSKDGELSHEEAAAVTSIGSLFAGKSISSFNELQYFTGLQSIEYYAFQYCSSLTSIHIPEGVTSIKDSAFKGCSSLTSITIPNGVTEIGSQVFMDCSSLTSITLPQTVSSLGDQVFEGCSSLSAFYGKYASVDHRCLIQDDGTLLAFLPVGLTKYTIPEGVTAIGSNAFRYCRNLTSITIPKGVTKIGQDAFSGCSSLTSITIPDGVTAIGMQAFYSCSSLTSVTIPETVTSIEESAFFSCYNLTSITIPKGVTKIGGAAFAGCAKLTIIYCKPTNPPTISNNTFPTSSSMKIIYVPAASVDAYKAANNWSMYASQIVADNN